MFLTGRNDFKKKFPNNTIESGMDNYPITE